VSLRDTEAEGDCDCSPSRRNSRHLTILQASAIYSPLSARQGCPARDKGLVNQSQKIHIDERKSQVASRRPGKWNRPAKGGVPKKTPNAPVVT